MNNLKEHFKKYLLYLILIIEDLIMQFIYRNRWKLNITSNNEIQFRRQEKKSLQIFGYTIIRGRVRESWNYLDKNEIHKITEQVKECIKNKSNLEISLGSEEKFFIHKKQMKDFLRDLDLIQWYIKSNIKISTTDIFLLKILSERELI